jgi:hypothetical protein
MLEPIVVTHPRQFKAAMSQHERPVIVQRNWRTLKLWCLLAVYEWASRGMKAHARVERVRLERGDNA